MRLRRRVGVLGGRLPGRRPAGVPTDPEGLLAGLLAGAVTLDDFDRTDADQVGALTHAAALLIARTGVGATDDPRAAGPARPHPHTPNLGPENLGTDF